MSTWNGSPALPSLLAGQIPQAGTDWLAIVDALHALSDAWTGYTPVWTSSGTAPNLGNGFIGGQYAQIGKTVLAYGVMTPGSTTTYGTGSWNISYPVAASSFVSQALGLVTCYHSASSTAHRPGGIIPNISTNGTFISTTGGVDASDPFVWANGDALRWCQVYAAL